VPIWHESRRHSTWHSKGGRAQSVMGGVDSNGMDLVRALCLGITGRPVRWVLRECRKWIVEQSDFMMYVQYGQLGRLTLTAWACSLRRIEEGACFARDDSGLLATICGAFFVKAGRGLKDWTTAARVFQKLVAMVHR